MRKRSVQCGCISFVFLIFISYCGVTNYITAQYSSSDYLQRIAGMSERGTLEEAHAAILQQLPVGTPKETIITYLESRGIEEDVFRGGQWMRYQVKDSERKVLVLLSEPSFPLRTNFACSRIGYIVHFNFDKQELLQEIAIDSTAICL